jgi:aminoglycoside 6'-N-acetyltransferase
MPSEVTFEPLTLMHRDLLKDWTSQPHVLEWWGEANQDVDAFFVEDDEHWPFVAVVDGEPVAYIQSWRPTRGEQYPWQHNLADDVRGMDLFIGPADKLDRGFGTTIVAAFAKKLFAEGAPKIYIDPNTKNLRAIRAYEKAGFRRLYEVSDIDGTSLLMEISQ